MCGHRGLDAGTRLARSPRTTHTPSAKARFHDSTSSCRFCTLASQKMALTFISRFFWRLVKPSMYAASHSKAGTRCYDPSQNSPRGNMGLCADDPSLRKGDIRVGDDGREWRVETRRKRHRKHGVDKYWAPIGPFYPPVTNGYTADARRNPREIWNSEFGGWFVQDPNGDWLFKSKYGLFAAGTMMAPFQFPHYDQQLDKTYYINGWPVSSKPPPQGTAAIAAAPTATASSTATAQQSQQQQGTNLPTPAPASAPAPIPTPAATEAPGIATQSSLGGGAWGGAWGNQYY